jgi:hypothetical protein
MRVRAAEIAKRIGPTIDELHAGGAVADDLIGSFALRGGYLTPASAMPTPRRSTSRCVTTWTTSPALPQSEALRRPDTDDPVNVLPLRK